MKIQNSLNEKIETNDEQTSQKLKILFLLKILLENTDENHDITLAQIQDFLQAKGISAKRKSLYKDIAALREFGIDIVCTQYKRTYHYQVVNRDFELAELKLLVDAVQASKFITEKKSAELIEKLEKCASKHELIQLNRQVEVAGRVKTMNERIYYNVDAIHTALSNDWQVEFQYFTWTIEKKMDLRHNGSIYRVSPWALCWDNEQYYLIGYDNIQQQIKHFRVDKMVNTNVVEERRIGQEQFEQFSISEYSNRLFGMFDGEERQVHLLCENDAANIIIDRFGTDIPITKIDENSFETIVKVSVSRLFLGWVMAVPGVKITEPQDVVDMMKEQINRLKSEYFM